MKSAQNGQCLANNIQSDFCEWETLNFVFSIRIALKFVHKDPITDNSALIQVMVSHRTSQNIARSKNDQSSKMPYGVPKQKFVKNLLNQTQKPNRS